LFQACLVVSFHRKDINLLAPPIPPPPPMPIKPPCPPVLYKRFAKI
jgi:hypothetical protein